MEAGIGKLVLSVIMNEMTNIARQQRSASLASAEYTDSLYVPYDKRNLSYANTFANPFKANTIRAIEWLTGKLHLLRLIRKFEQSGVRHGQGFWADALHAMGIELATPGEQIKKIPESGPVVVVANHPHGLVDGMILAELIGRVRTDYKILTRSILTGVSAVEMFMIPVPFPHEEGAREKNLEMRNKAMMHLDKGGLIALFPAGVVATSERLFGPAVEAEWNLFTARMIRRSGATVVPVFFPGSNSRLYHIANRFSATLRQGLLIHEVRKALNRPQAPVVGESISPQEIKIRSHRPRRFLLWLRLKTLALKSFTLTAKP